jgi:biopolymer transport protein ExbD
VADQRHFLDVWILESNTVYREVPYNVVTDWAQQGRLLPDDNVRPSGTNQWNRLGDLPAFAAFVPKPVPYRVEDQAEALEAVHTDVVVKKRHADEDEDVDMIPLIDISLVLLIFFMMTATTGGAASLFDTPEAHNMLITTQPDMLWVGINKGKDGNPEYSFGRGDTDDGQTFASRDELVRAFGEALRKEPRPVNVNIKANRNLPFDVVSDMTVALERFKVMKLVANVYGGVSERQDQ